jgi:hypothetical protein
MRCDAMRGCLWLAMSKKYSGCQPMEGREMEIEMEMAGSPAGLD